MKHTQKGAANAALRPAARAAAVTVADTTDAGRVRLGAGVRILPRRVAKPDVAALVADTGRVRLGAGVRILPRRA
jgi:hypothetical protein